MIDRRMRAVASEQHGLVTAQQARQAGISRAELRARLGTGEWRSLCRGVYLVDARRNEDPDSLSLRAALLALGPDSVAVLDTAARIHGIAGLPWPPSPCQVSRPRSSPRLHRADLRVHHLTVPPEHVVALDGLRLTTPLRTLVDLLCRLDRTHAVAVADSMLRLSPDLDVAEVHALLRARRRWGGLRGLAWFALADGRAESPLESRVRLACLDGEVPPDELQLPVLDAGGRLLGIADMAWEAQRLIVEADGAAPHEEPKALFRDRRRQNDLANAGWRVLRFTWADTLRKGYVAATVRRALGLPAQRVSGSAGIARETSGPNR